MPDNYEGRVMSERPVIPKEIRSYEFAGYTNVYKILPHAKNLYATETLFGGWDAPTLLLGKDAAPTQVIENCQSWRHAQKELGDTGGWKTNECLKDLAAIVPGSKLYGSA